MITSYECMAIELATNLDKYRNYGSVRFNYLIFSVLGFSWSECVFHVCQPMNGRRKIVRIDRLKTYLYNSVALWRAQPIQCLNKRVFEFRYRPKLAHLRWRYSRKTLGFFHLWIIVSRGEFICSFSFALGLWLNFVILKSINGYYARYRCRVRIFTVRT